MAPTRRSALRSGCGLVAFGSLAGCVGDSSSSESNAGTGTRRPAGPASPENTAVDTDTEQPTTTPQGTETRNGTINVTPTNGTTAVNRGCNGARGLLFKPHKRNGMTLWNRHSVQVGGFSLGPNANVLLVVYEDDTVLGTAELHAPDVTMVVDAMSIPLKKPLTGEHTIRVVMYADSDGDGNFDPANATPCRYEGEVIQAGPETFDFSEFAPGTSTTP
jgi:hypothetical protein